ncbi:MAG: hypothetical protein M1819_003407 [Sarea resinae]|nr:MAG: hypothetical protein M1819_003407 [Sarea resinae]
MPPVKRKRQSSDGVGPASVDAKRPRRSTRAVAEQPTARATRAARAETKTTTAPKPPKPPKSKPATKPSAKKKTASTRSAPNRVAASTAKPVTDPKPTRAAKSTTAEKPKRAAKATMGRPVGRPKKATAASKTAARTPRKTIAKGRRTKATMPPVKKSRKLAVEIETEPVVEEEEEIADEDGHCFWLMKAEPESRIEKGVDVKFSIDDLEASTEPQPWDGVRNYVGKCSLETTLLGIASNHTTARNNMRAMQKGDQAFFYHSNCKVPGIVGLMEIVREHSVDDTALDPSNPYYDPKSSPENPKWSLVHVEFRRKFPEMITLAELRTYAQPGGVLEKMELLKQGRLSVSKVTKKQWDFILRLADQAEVTTARAASSPDGALVVESENVPQQEVKEAQQDDDAITAADGARDGQGMVAQDLADDAARDILTEVVQEAADEVEDLIMTDVAEHTANEAERDFLADVVHEASNEAQKDIFEEIVQEAADDAEKQPQAREGVNDGFSGQPGLEIHHSNPAETVVQVEETIFTANGHGDDAREMNDTTVDGVLFKVNGVHS